MSDGVNSGELSSIDPGYEARRVKAAACALIEPNVVSLCRNRLDLNTMRALSRFIVDALPRQAEARPISGAD